jgi:multidrug efflux pump subunit AcrA (membrane-fusion protein)
MSHTPVTTGVNLDGELGDANLPNLLVRPVNDEEPLVALLPPSGLEDAAPREVTAPARPARDTTRGFTGAGDPVPGQDDKDDGKDGDKKDVDTLRGYQLPGPVEPRATPDLPPARPAVTEAEPEEERPAPPAPPERKPARPLVDTEETHRLLDQQRTADTLVTASRWSKLLRWGLLVLPATALVALVLADRSPEAPTAEVAGEPATGAAAEGPTGPPEPSAPARALPIGRGRQAPLAPPAPPPALVARGAIEPRMRAGVRSRLGGEIAEVLVVEGQRVREGDVLVRLVTTDYQRELEVTREAVAQARARLEAIGAAPATAATETPDEEVASARQAVRAAQAAEREAQLRLGDTTIAAPFAGQVIARDARPGEPVAPGPQGRSLVTLADLSEGYVRIDLPAADAARLRVGQRARIATSGGERPGEVAVISGAGSDGKVPVRVRLGPVEATLLGHEATVTFER